MRRSLFALSLVTIALPLSSGAKPTASGSDAQPPLPAPLATGAGTKVSRSQIPAFLALFGPATLIEKTGFRTAVGRWIEYRLLNAASGGASSGTLRIQEVGPRIPGEHWFEMLGDTGGGMSARIRMLTRGTRDGNVRRLIAQIPGFTTLELPLDSVTASPLSPGSPTGTLSLGQALHAVATKVGHGFVVVPLGKFECDHWVVKNGEARVDFWTTTDEKVPFIGAVKIGSPQGDAVAAKVGTDAVAQIAVPPKSL